MSRNILIEFSARDISENVFLLVFLPSEELKQKEKVKDAFFYFLISVAITNQHVKINI